jgi:mRNA interferase YafQ
MRLLTTKRFGRDLKRAKKRGKDLGRLWGVVDRLLGGQALDLRYRRHRLSGAWSGSWECHIEPDWLLIWIQDEDALVLVRTGTHSDLFS